MATTKAVVSTLYCEFVRVAEEAGLDMRGTALHQGNSSYNIAWTLIYAGGDHPRNITLGYTTREARRSLEGLTQGVRMAVEDRN